MFSGEEGIDEVCFSKLQEGKPHFDYQSQGIRNHVTFSNCQSCGWYVLRIVEHDQLYSKVKQMLLFAAVIAVLIIVAFFFPIQAFSNGFTRPIIRLQKSMVRLAGNHFDPFTESEEETEIILSEKGGNEISLLIDVFNSMSVKLHSLIQSIYRTENEKHQLEIMALSAQINPHFTYNTLGTIKQMALLQNSQGIADLTDSVIHLLRAVAKYGNGVTTLKTELDLIQDYISVMQMRYYENFEVSIHAEEELLEKKIPSMLLQPIVENAIFHGILGIDRQGVISIDAHREDEKLYITVSDNGKGGDFQQIQLFLKAPGHAEKKNENIGIYNVHRRIQLYYGSEYGLTFEANQPFGTRAAIIIPL